MRRLIPLFGLIVAGCTSINPGKNPEQVEISGKVTMNGRPVSDVVFNLQPTGQGTQAVYPVVNGTFKGSATPGKYTYYITEGKNPAVYNAIPQRYRGGSMDRVIEIKSGTELTIDLN
jgi:hypothetical protein